MILDSVQHEVVVFERFFPKLCVTFAPSAVLNNFYGKGRPSVTQSFAIDVMNVVEN